MLEGRISSTIKRAKTKESKEYLKFMLAINSYSKDVHDSSEQRNDILLPLLVFDKRIVTYLEHVGARCGNRVSILARLNSYKDEDEKGNIIHHTCIIARDIQVLKTKKE